jgi:HPt (histidine-containing phosphotransfer) domain-containing protein
LEKNIISDDKKTFIRNAHTLKSNSATVGALKLSELAAILEHEGEHSNLSDLAGKLNEAKAELEQVIVFFIKFTSHI